MSAVDNDHLATWEAETTEPARSREWHEWIEKAERLAGHSLDGDEATNGYSMDGAHAAWQSWMTPEKYVARIAYTKQTPPVIDAELARLHGIVRDQEQPIRHAFDALHRIAGHKPHYSRRGSLFAERDADAETLVRTRLADGVYTVRPWDEDSARRALAALDAARATARAARAAMAPLDAEWDRRRWSRFFLVTGGHIHASTGCHTLRPTTMVGWLPDLSGLSEADAVAAHGTILCTHCFPTAPVEWTVGPVKAEDPTTCPGSGRGPVSGTIKHRAYSAYGRCPECGTDQVVTAAVRVRKHRRPA